MGDDLVKIVDAERVNALEKHITYHEDGSLSLDERGEIRLKNMLLDAGYHSISIGDVETYHTKAHARTNPNGSIDLFFEENILSSQASFSYIELGDLTELEEFKKEYGRLVKYRLKGKFTNELKEELKFGITLGMGAEGYILGQWIVGNGLDLGGLIAYPISVGLLGVGIAFITHKQIKKYVVDQEKKFSNKYESQTLLNEEAYQFALLPERIDEE